MLPPEEKLNLVVSNRNELQPIEEEQKIVVTMVTKVDLLAKFPALTIPNDKLTLDLERKLSPHSLASSRSSKKKIKKTKKVKKEKKKIERSRSREKKQDLEKGRIYEGFVTKVQDFGVFV
jgi:polyribonucleotide nucleotidyltransferase